MGRPFLFPPQGGNHRVDVGTAHVTAPGKPVGDDAIGIEHDNDRVRDTVRVAAGGIVFVEQSERTDDLGVGVGEDRIFHFPAFGEPRQLLDRIISNGCDLVAERSEFIDPFVPGDRLDDAEWSPIERSREQQDQPVLALQRGEIAHLVELIGHGERVGERCPDLGTLVEDVEIVVRGSVMRRPRQEQYDQRRRQKAA